MKNIKYTFINIVDELFGLKKFLIVAFLIISFKSSYYFKKKELKINGTRQKNSFKQINNNFRIKVCICTLGKNENKYIKEFLDYYKQIGVDKIFLYDNNDIGYKNESFDEIISEYIKDGFVNVINYKGEKYPQFKIYTDCYRKNNKIYDWLIFFDIDEFINLENYKSIKDFLNEEKFNKCKIIYFNSLRHTDNDLIFYDNRTLAKRFPKIRWHSKMFTLKSIARGGIKKIKFRTSHWLDRKINGCNVYGEFVIPSRKVRLNNNINDPKFKKYYIDHYCFKSTEEYINKINKGDAIFGFNNRTKMHKIRIYFKYNRITQEKINYLEQKTGLNLNAFRLKLNKTSYMQLNYLVPSLISK